MASRASRLQDAFRRCAEHRTGALLPYFTAGYPRLHVTAELLRRADRLGVAAVELGFPYSDSIADGPTITSSYQHALDQGLHVGDVFDMVASVRSEISIPLSAMVSYSIVDRIGLSSFVRRAADAGFDALIIPDLSLEEADEVADALRGAGLDLAMLVAPTSSPRRRERICRLSSGFLYYVSVAGITGERDRLPADLADNLQELRTHTPLPICVGFGVSKPQHVRAVCKVADGAIVGSAIIRHISASLDAGYTEGRIVETVGHFLGELLEATHKKA